jgi:4-hydroxy-tetrahydrodipicolinate synthase
MQGIIPAVITPFTDDERLDLGALEEVIERLLGAGVHGLFVVGSQGEFFALDDAEQRAVIGCAVRATAGRVPVYAGVSSISTRHAVRLAQQASAAGADGLTVLPPYFIRPDATELQRHFEAIADAGEVPVILYNQPARTGTAISTQLVRALAAHERIAALKDSGADLNRTCEFLAAAPDGFAVLVGNDAQIAFGLLAGAPGAVAAGANVFPELCVAIYDAVAAGEVETALRLQAGLARFRSSWELGSFPVVVKEALTMLGLPAGPCRRPIAPLTDAARDALRRVLDEVADLQPAQR